MSKAASKIIAERHSAAPAPAALPDEPNNAHRAPVAKVGFGGIQASVWANHGEKGEFHTVTFTRRYQENGEWKSSNSYGANDLLALQKVADLAVDKIIELQQGRGRSA